MTLRDRFLHHVCFDFSRKSDCFVRHLFKDLKASLCGVFDILFLTHVLSNGPIRVSVMSQSESIFRLQLSLLVFAEVLDLKLLTISAPWPAVNPY